MRLSKESLLKLGNSKAWIDLSDRLEEEYRKIPRIECEKGCGKCCGPIHTSLIEAINLQIYTLKNGIESELNGLYCPYLAKDKSCKVYEARPLVCRAFGVLKHPNTKCPIVVPRIFISQYEFQKIQEQIGELCTEARELLEEQEIREHATD